MKRTGIKATEEELERLKSAAAAPVIGGPAMPPPQDPAKLAHEIALKHGLPEIPGFYGCDLKTGEFVAADNAPLPEGLADKVQPSARELAIRVLGKGVHPCAIDRLFEVWPEAAVQVDRYVTRRKGVDGIRATRVVVAATSQEGPRSHSVVERSAYCDPGDTFDKRTGIRLAFDRCLREAVRRADPGRVSGIGRSR